MFNAENYCRLSCEVREDRLLMMVDFCFQLGRKQKAAEEDKRETAPSTVCDEAATSDFTSILLSLPYQEPEDEKQAAAQPLETAGQPSAIPSEKQQTSSSQTLSTSVVTKTLLSTRDLSQTSQVHLTESNKEEETIGKGKDLVADLTGGLQGANLEAEKQLWNSPRVSSQFEIQNVPSAPALYPSLPTLEDVSLIQLHGDALKNCGKGPAVLALPEQESSPPSLRPVESKAELSRIKLYPDLPKTATEIPVISYTNI